MLKKHIYLPLEILPRELNSKILLSLFAAKKNIEFIWGPNSQLIIFC